MIQTPVTRRQLLMSLIGMACWASAQPRMAFANNQRDRLDWDSFVLRMVELADEYDAGGVTRDHAAARGMQHLVALDINGGAFANAVAAAYESGNEYWMWQRMLKKRNVNGGILTIDSSRAVQLHDHPGAAGILRIISGEAEIWQYDRVGGSRNGSTARLRRTGHRIVRPGDTAVLTPDKGNIHALRSISAECRMLDFFIPPYNQSQRTWFEPLGNNWQKQQQITCRCFSQHEFARASSSIRQQHNHTRGAMS